MKKTAIIAIDSRRSRFAAYIQSMVTVCLLHYQCLTRYERSSSH